MSKQDGKNEIITGLGSLLVLVFGYLLLNTINPDILNLNFGLKTVELSEVMENGEKISIKYDKIYDANNACPGQSGKEAETCVIISSAIRLKSGIGNKLEVNFEKKLQQLSQKLQAAGVTWYVSEAWKPTYGGHKASCHRNGTCVDANHISSAGAPISNPQTIMIKEFINAATAVGLCPVYEVHSASRKDELVNSGISQKNVKALGSHITAPHYSIYSGTCK